MPHQKPPADEQKYVLSKLNAAEAFETFLQTKYVGQKRFSLEGGETVIPLLDAVLDKAAEHEHGRGRHRHGAPRPAQRAGQHRRQADQQIFREFEGNLDPDQAHGSGDVKYHLGAEGKYFRMFGDGETTVSLAANPSHLEAVDPVLEGIVRAKQDLLDKGHEGYTVLPLMLHGDAAFAGQGVVAETLNLSLLRGYRTGGTVHVVINNQVGFTTAPETPGPAQYCTDVAKMIGAPIFHVNGDDPEACVWVARLAVEYRQALAQRRRDRHALLPAPRAQRGRRPVDDQPADVPDHRRQALRSQDLHRGADRPRRHLAWRRPRRRCSDYSASWSRCSTRSTSWSGRRVAAQPFGGARAGACRPIGRLDAAGGDPPDRRRARRAAGGLHPAPAGQAGAGAAGEDVPRGRHRLGLRRAPRVRLAGDGRAAGAAVRAGHPARHVRAAALGGDRPPYRRGVLPAAQPLPRARSGSWPTTRRCPSSRRWASSTATRWRTRTRWCSGRRSSATSSTALSR